MKQPKQSGENDKYFVLRVALDDIRPAIWRRVAVPASITLDLLHDVLQATMGWEDYHLHQFTINGQRFTEDPEQSEEGAEESGIGLSALVRNVKMKFEYLYDVGDGWRHTVTVEKIEPVPEGSMVRMACLAGKRRCPPEDVGGPWGYENYLDAIADPKHAEHTALLGWRGPFDPDEFDIEIVNRELAKLARWSRPRRRPPASI